MRKTTDILISGGGVAGLTAAAAFGSAGFEVLCIEPTPPVTDATSPGADLRTTAHAQKLLTEHEMGELFKVIGFARGCDPAFTTAPLGFAHGDRTHTL